MLLAQVRLLHLADDTTPDRLAEVLDALALPPDLPGVTQRYVHLVLQDGQPDDERTR